MWTSTAKQKWTSLDMWLQRTELTAHLFLSEKWGQVIASRRCPFCIFGMFGSLMLVCAVAHLLILQLLSWPISCIITVRVAWVLHCTGGRVCIGWRNMLVLVLCPHTRRCYLRKFTKKTLGEFGRSPSCR